MDYVNQTWTSLELFVVQILMFIPKLLVAYIIWLIGNWLISKFLEWISKVDIKDITIDDQIRGMLSTVLRPLSKVLLALIILDTLGIGSNVVSALTNAMSLTIAIALGMSFGQALTPWAKGIVDETSKHVNKK